MRSALPMATCNHCGAQVEAHLDHCPNCELQVPNSRQDLRVAPNRLVDAPQVTAGPPQPGAWSRADDVHEPDESAEIRLTEQMFEPIREGANERSDELPEGAPTEDAIATPEAPNPTADPEGVHDEEPPASIPPAHRPSGPPVLASEALQRELTPAEPGRITLRWLGFGGGLAGIGLTWATLGPAPQTLPVAAGFLALLSLAFVPMPFAGRAAAIAMVAGGGLFSATWLRFARGLDPAGLGLLLVVVLLGASLHLRAWHRASDVARILVALGLTAGIAWLAAKGSLSDLSTLEADWRAALPRVLQIPFGLLLMLSLLAFMDGRTTGACGAWAIAMWMWYASFLAVELLTHVWTDRGPDWSLMEGSQIVAMFSTPLLAPLVGVGVAQLIAHSLSRHGPQQEAPSNG